MASSWTAKLHYNIKLPGVHKWEKRWVSKGSMMVFKWVRKAERCEFKGEAENGEGEDSSLQDHAAAGFETEAEASQRRLTRGKAADMGIVVEKISDTNEDLLRTAPAPAPRKPAGAQDAGSAAVLAQEASGSAEEGAAEAGRKRRRDTDDEVAEEEQSETKLHDTEGASKKARTGDEPKDGDSGQAGVES